MPNYFYKIYPVAFIILATINIYKEIIVLKATYMLMLFYFLRMLFVYIPANC